MTLHPCTLAIILKAAEAKADLHFEGALSAHVGCAFDQWELAAKADPLMNDQEVVHVVFHELVALGLGW